MLRSKARSLFTISSIKEVNSILFTDPSLGSRLVTPAAAAHVKFALKRPPARPWPPSL